jgi:pyrroline-5-carboxylate reductase
MENITLGFIGGGRVTRIILQAFKNRNVSFKDIVIVDTNIDVLARINKDFPGVKTTSEDLQAATKNNIVFIALHPPVIIEILEKINQFLNAETVLVSLAPKITIEKISAKLDGYKNIARLIPNAPSFINEGFNPVSFSAGLSPENMKVLLRIFEILGKCIVVDESKLEAYAIITAMSPTYFWFQFNELVEIGQKIGLTKEECRIGLSETIKSSVNTLFSSDIPREDVVDLIPVRPISDHESEIRSIYNSKLITLFEKIKP